MLLFVCFLSVVLSTCSSAPERGHSCQASRSECSPATVRGLSKGQEGAVLSEEPRWVPFPLFVCFLCPCMLWCCPTDACPPALPPPPPPGLHCSGASVEAVTALVCLTLDRGTFTAVLGPLQQLMSREKSPAVTAQRLMKLQSRGGPSRVPAEVMVRRKRRSKSRGTDVWEVIRARGHLDEVLELRSGSSAPAAQASSAALAGGAAAGSGGEADGGQAAAAASGQLVLTEGQVLGGGAFSRVSVVSEQTVGRTYALKRMRKSAVVQCPEHVFCEQTITRNLTHPFCIRQYASFQVWMVLLQGGRASGRAPGACAAGHVACMLLCCCACCAVGQSAGSVGISAAAKSCGMHLAAAPLNAAGVLCLLVCFCFVLYSSAAPGPLGPLCVPCVSLPLPHPPFAPQDKYCLHILSV